MKTDFDMNDFVRRGGARMTLGDVKRVVASLPAIRKEIETINEEEYPGLAAQIDFLAEVLADFNAGNFDSLPFEAAAEVAFALNYLAKEVDLIPDFVPDVGFIDDATVVLIVLRHHQEVLATHPEASEVDWEFVAG
jgi:uncharacterized membrane protein YkvA (DUF1232 family)